MYRDFKLKINYIRYMEALRNRGMLRSSPVGEGMLYSSSLEDQLKAGYDLLSEDVYTFLEHPTVWRDGVIPFEGPAEKIDFKKAETINWDGFRIHNL